jgi:hypothetical protein
VKLLYVERRRFLAKKGAAETWLVMASIEGVRRRMPQRTFDGLIILRSRKGNKRSLCAAKVERSFPLDKFLAAGMRSAARLLAVT